MLKLDYFKSKQQKKLLASNSNCIKTQNYTLYFIYYYQNYQIQKYLYKICFIINFQKKINLKLKKFQIKYIKIITLSSKITLYQKIYNNNIKIRRSLQLF